MDRLHITLLRCLLLPRFGGAAFQRLHQCWPADHWSDASVADLAAHGWPLALAEAFARVEPPLALVDSWLAGGVRRSLLALTDDHYPWLLRHIQSPPLLLFVDGDAGHLSRPQLAVVGSRQPAPPAAGWLRQQMPALAAAGLAITSGLARGIDGVAHEAALAAGAPTIAVMGTGPDLIYPAVHRRLAAAIVEQGALVSEFLPGTAANTDHFPRRNRIISGLARGVLVVAAAERSGSLITARMAAEQGRDVFAVPGAPGNPLAAGCNRLIQEGAKLVACADDITDEWGLSPLLPAAASEPKTALPMPALLDSVGDEPTPVDLVAVRSGLSVAKVLEGLLELELCGAITAVPGGFQRLRRTDHV